MKPTFPSPPDSAWFSGVPGRYLLSLERECFAHLSCDIFGFNAVQIGCPSIDFLSENRMPNRFIMATDVRETRTSKRISLVGNPLELPFETGSVDLVALPHTLDFTGNREALFEEVDRVLIPDGHVIVSAFNAYSLFGMKQKFSGIFGRPFVPGATFSSRSDVFGLFSEYGFEPEYGYFRGYCYPFSGESGYRRFAFLEKAGDRWWPHGAAVSVVSAVKRTPAMTAIKAKFKEVPQELLDAAPVNRKTNQG